MHSIAYEALPHYSLVFGVRDDVSGLFWDWDMVAAQAVDLGLPTVPVLFRGVVASADELRSLTERLARQTSVLGGSREGVVARIAGQFPEAAFSKNVAKWVRKDHVQTDEHWMHQAITAQKLA